MFSKRNFIFCCSSSLTSLILACGSTETVEVVKEVEVIKEVEVEKVVTEEKVVEVEVEKVVEVAAPEEDTVDLTWGKKKIEGVFDFDGKDLTEHQQLLTCKVLKNHCLYTRMVLQWNLHAESWDVSADGKYLNIKIKDGINFTRQKDSKLLNLVNLMLLTFVGTSTTRTRL
ncbi:MAG: hypothetical protein CM15mP91_0320 [Chloroflexota bacterium]|nr:MAG: hypothetical protein CM15mP91_0320 [Chloroflexota bacterium]